MAKTNFRIAFLAAIGLSLNKKESEQDFAVRVAEHISEKVDEETYAALPKEAIKWYESAVAALEKEKAVPLLPAAESEPEPEPEKPAAKKAAGKTVPAAKKSKADPEPEKPAAKKAAAKTAAPAKKAAAKAEKEEAGEPRFSVSDLVKVLVCKNPKLTKEQIKGKLDEGGHELADAQLRNVYSNTQRVLTILSELGWAKQAKA